MTRTISCLYVRKMILILMFSSGSMLACWAGGPNSWSSDKAQTATIEMPSGDFTFELGPFSYDESSLNLSIIARPKDGSHQVKIADEANALRTFLAGASNNGFQINSLSIVYMPETLEEEVQERLANAAQVSRKWRHNSASRIGDEMTDLLLASNAFKEIGEVFHKYGLRITGFGAEKILARRLRIQGHKSLLVPYSATITMNVHKELK
jgi:hypothetical protein